LLNHYIKQFSKLNRATVNGDKAPHKPILLLCIIQLIEIKEITENTIFITPELVATFKDIWSLLVRNPKFTANFSLPFFHLQSDKFWHLHTYPGKEIILTSSHSIKSFAHLKEAVWYASFDEPLFALLMNENDRLILKQTLLGVYFPQFHRLTLYQPNSIANEIANQILKETSATYQRQIERADEEEIFIRNGVFKKLIPTIYNHCCCISRMRIVSTYNIQMIDACHIIPFAVSHDDTIVNGIPLCPNLHRAFDRGLITINEDYKVIVSQSFHEDEQAYSIKQYEGAMIALPKEKKYYPAVDNLAWHSKHVFK